MFILKLLLNICALCALSYAIPTSILEDLKDAQLQTPIRATNKVKRAQEFIMFGNQQNRAPSTNFGSSRSEKRATEIDDNNLSDDDEPIAQVMPQTEESAYENNHLGTDKSYPFSSKDLYYNMLLRNLELTQNLQNDPVFNYDYPAYSIMDGRYKRDTKSNKASQKPLYRSKREHVLNPEEFLALLKMSENNKENAVNKFYKDRASIGWPVYESDSDDFPAVDDDDDNNYGVETSDENNGWYNNGMFFHPRFGHVKDGFRSNRPHKRFMVSKRRMGSDSPAQYSPYGAFDTSDGIPLHRRLIL